MTVLSLTPTRCDSAEIGRNAISLIVFHHKGSHLLLRRREIVLLSPDVVEQLHYVSHSSSSSHASAPSK